MSSGQGTTSQLSDGGGVTTVVLCRMLLLANPWNYLFWSSFTPLFDVELVGHYKFECVMEFPYWQFPICIWFLLSKCNILHVALLNFILISGHHSKLLISFQILIQTSQGFPPSQLLNIANFINVISFPFNWVIMKILNRAGARTDPWGIPPEASSCFDSEPLIATPWKQLFSQLFPPPHGNFI